LSVIKCIFGNGILDMILDITSVRTNMMIPDVEDTRAV